MLNVTATFSISAGPVDGFKIEDAFSSFFRKAVQALLNPHFSSECISRAQ
jgi:hypothetical protein